MHPMAYVGIALAILMVLTFIIFYFIWRKIVVVCENCGHVYKPKFLKFMFSPHMFENIYMKCPACGERCSQKVEDENEH